MFPRFYHMLVAAVAVAATTTVAFAQQAVPASGDVHQHDAAGAAVCGYGIFNDGGERAALTKTAASHPAVYQRIVERAKHDARASIASSGDNIEFTFLVRNRATGEYEEVIATLVYQGINARIWIDNRDTARIKAATITSLARGLDTLTPAKSRNPGSSIIVNDEQVFGMPPANRFDPGTPGTTDFLMTDIKDNLIGAFVAGFFSPWDQTDNPGSNKMNLLYIDSKEGLSSGISEVLNTLAHEFQHLIHYAQNNTSQVVFNEGCSEVASILNGYQTRDNRNYLKNTNLAMFTWHYDDGAKVLIDYERAMTFTHYMFEQAGEGFLTAFTRSQSEGMDRVAEALRIVGDNRPVREFLSNYVAANYLGTSFHQPYAYRNRLSTSTPTAAASFSGQFADTGSLYMQQYGSAYVVYNSPGPIGIKFKASQDIRVMAMLYKGTTPVEVWTLENDSTYLIGGYAKYDKVVFGIANLAFNGQTVRWNIDKLSLGVDDAAGTAGAFAVTSVSPNPVAGAAVVVFHTQQAGTMTAQLFDMRGALVNTLVDNARYEAGDHSIGFSSENLLSGVYVLRLQQNGHSVTREVIVAR